MKQDLQEWFSQELNKQSDDLLYKTAFKDQVMFVRDDIRKLIATGLSYDDAKHSASVISTHRSKSVILPVYMLERKDLGLTLIARNNFYNWKLSVISELPLDCDFRGLCYTTPPTDPDYTGDPLHKVYFEGFPEEYIFGYYSENKSKFSLEIWGDYKFYCAVYNIMKATGSINHFKWSTKSDLWKVV